MYLFQRPSRGCLEQLFSKSECNRIQNAFRWIFPVSILHWMRPQCKIILSVTLCWMCQMVFMMLVQSDGNWRDVCYWPGPLSIWLSGKESNLLARFVLFTNFPKTLIIRYIKLTVLQNFIWNNEPCLACLFHCSVPLHDPLDSSGKSSHSAWICWWHYLLSHSSVG